MSTSRCCALSLATSCTARLLLRDPQIPVEVSYPLPLVTGEENTVETLRAVGGTKRPKRVRCVSAFETSFKILATLVCEPLRRMFRNNPSARTRRGAPRMLLQRSTPAT